MQTLEMLSNPCNIWKIVQVNKNAFKFQLFPIGKESVTFPCDSNVLLPAVN